MNDCNILKKGDLITAPIKDEKFCIVEIERINEQGLYVYDKFSDNTNSSTFFVNWKSCRLIDDTLIYALTHYTDSIDDYLNSIDTLVLALYDNSWTKEADNNNSEYSSVYYYASIKPIDNTNKNTNFTFLKFDIDVISGYRKVDNYTLLDCPLTSSKIKVPCIIKDEQIPDEVIYNSINGTVCKKRKIIFNNDISKSNVNNDDEIHHHSKRKKMEKNTKEISKTQEPILYPIDSIYLPTLNRDNEVLSSNNNSSLNAAPFVVIA